MSRLLKKSGELSFTTNILIKEEDGMFVAHCLELDIVAVAPSIDDARREVVSLICAQIDYAFSNNNFDNLYRPAPSELWKEFYMCKEQEERIYDIKTSDPGQIVPPWLITKICNNICFSV